MPCVGTCHFVSFAAACRYYEPYGFGPKAIQRKLDEKEIIIGKPEIKPGQSLYLVDNYTRYAIDEGTP